ncbi:PAS domain-containing protein [uncultured Roseibium sp.]|uniref:helix-turn-helix transcriptional regulator n=1 Tax=uncultured Roseibium sp. TaxID=1936171 RepID=UPI00262A155B|nr:PAS domain-containing protein [uncultured Roseibium sp.]
MKFSSELSSFKPVCKAITLLFPDMVEVVLHDLATGRIAWIENGFSARAVGDDSLMETENYASDLRADGTIGPYRKSGPDGARLKSVSAIIRNDDGDPVGLICINFKTGDLELAGTLLRKMTDFEAGPEVTLLKNDWRELTNTIIEDTLKDLKISFNQLRRPGRVEIIKRLLRADILSARGAGDYVAQALGISRASFYAMLREARDQERHGLQ